MNTTPKYPAAVIPRPFGAGDLTSIQAIPDEKQIQGRASFIEGFPIETQRPLAEGGIAPHRVDFQSLFHLLTTFGHWQQSGGLWKYSADLNYTAPCVVHHKKELWWCLATNGPDTENGKKIPGDSENSEYWELLSAYLMRSFSTGTSGSGFVPVGTVLSYYGVSAPEGYLSCAGESFDSIKYPKLAAILGSSTTPDMQGVTIRGLDPTGSRDPDGATRSIGSFQKYAMQRITGFFRMVTGGPIAATGAFYIGRDVNAQHIGASVYYGYQYSTNIDTARVVETAGETRMSNVALLYIIKHD